MRSPSSDAKPDVVWCFYDRDPERKYPKVLERLSKLGERASLQRGAATLRARMDEEHNFSAGKTSAELRERVRGVVLAVHSGPGGGLPDVVRRGAGTKTPGTFGVESRLRA